ncbi:hypothetical protein SRIMM317S_03597 [Streptomyces rimosus subsp. rimosus]
MSVKQVLRAVSGAVLVGALVIGTAPAASADYIRDGQWSLGAFRADKIRQQSTGKNVTVAVIDSGVNGDHPDLKGNVLPGKSFAPGGGTADHEDSDDHGTAMAALIAGHGHGPSQAHGIMGLAHGCENPAGQDTDFRGHSVRTRLCGSAPLRGRLRSQGCQYVVRAGADRRRREKAINYALQKDVLLVAGTGNDGESTPQYPAAAPGVLAVGAVTKNNQSRRTRTTVRISASSPPAKVSTPPVSGPSTVRPTLRRHGLRVGCGRARALQVSGPYCRPGGQPSDEAGDYS